MCGFCFKGYFIIWKRDKVVLWNRIFIPNAVSDVSGYLHILLVLPVGKILRSPTGKVQVILQTVAVL